MKFTQNAWMAFLGTCLFLLSGCGDTFRPIANPISFPNPAPQGFGSAFVLSNGGTNSGLKGYVTEINVSGDSIMQQVSVGSNPVSAFVSGTTVYTANQGDDTISTYSSATTAPSVNTINLPAGSAPVYVLPAGSDVYVANSGAAHKSVGIIGFSSASASSTFVAEVPLDSNPAMLAALSDGSKVYSVNPSTNDVNVISTKDNTVVATILLPSGSTPVRAVVSSDNLRLFVINQGSNNVSVINTNTNAVVSTVNVGTAPGYAVFDPTLIRLYVANTQSNNVSVINADPNSSGFLTVRNIAVGTTPVAIAALADGSRVYTANSGSNDVTVINALSYTVTKTVSLGAGTKPVSIVSSPDSSKVYVADQGSTDIAIVRTSDDTQVLPSTLNGQPARLHIQQDPNCVPTSQQACPFSVPAFVTAP